MAGELIVPGQWPQAELGGLLMGEQTPFTIRRGSPQGLGQPGIKANDTVLGHAAGAYGGPDYAGVRVVTLDMFIGQTVDDPWQSLQDLIEAWAPSTTDVELHLQLPDPFGHFYVIGRPRGCEVDMERMALPHFEAQCTFVALDPTIYSGESS